MAEKNTKSVFFFNPDSSRKIIHSSPFVALREEKSPLVGKNRNNEREGYLPTT